MRIFINTTDACDEQGAREILAQIQERPDAVLGFATGSTPIGLYRKLIEKYQANEVGFSQSKTFNLDEYVGIPEDHPCSYHRFMWENLFDHIDIQREAVAIPDGNASDLSMECIRYEERIQAAGGIDLQVLGIGHNGHIGFNEPGTPFDSTTQVINLTRSTIDANARFFDEPDQVPRQAVSMGIKTIMRARKILLLVKGADKADILQKALYGPVTPMVPASILQLHPNLSVLVDNAAAAKLPDKAPAGVCS